MLIIDEDLAMMIDPFGLLKDNAMWIEWGVWIEWLMK